MKQLNPEVEQRFSDWQRGLATRGRTISAAVTDRQVELHHLVSEGPLAFASYLRGRLGLIEDDPIDAPALPRDINADEYRDPPFSLERTLVESWEGIIRRQDASRPLFWALAHVRWLEEGKLGNAIEETLLRGGGRDSTDDQRTRNLLRRIGGLPHVRGKVSVLSDSPISRSWWRGSVASEIADTAGNDLTLGAADLHRILHSHNDAWARLVGDSVHRITVMNQPRARAALVSLYEGATREGNPVQPLEMQLAARMLSRNGVSLALELLTWNELTVIAEESLQLARAHLELEEQQRTRSREERAAAPSNDSPSTQPRDQSNRRSRWTSFFPFARG